LLAVIQRMRDDDRIDGVILGGTELPLILGESAVNGVMFLDTTKIHVKRALDWLDE
jgi:aspartate racemase